MKTGKILFGLLFLFVVSSPVLALSSPANFNALAYPGEKVSLSWQSVPGAAGYNIYRKAESEGSFLKVNSFPVAGLAYDDKGVAQGKNYEYQITAVEGSGAESTPSILASAPHMVLSTSAVVTHTGKATEIKSRVTGKNVSVAVPGDIISYRIFIANNGYGKALNAVVSYPIPSGTRLIPNSVDPNGFKAVLEYFDARKGNWVSIIDNISSISKIRVKIAEPINPKATGYSGQISFKVLIEV